MTAKKFDSGKPPMDLLPAEALEMFLDWGASVGAYVHPPVGLAKFAKPGGGKLGLLQALANLDENPWNMLVGVSRVLAFGADKYDAHNWREGMQWSRLIAAALRHWAAIELGEDVDPESGLPHKYHFGCCVFFLLSYFITESGTDDRYRPKTIAVG